MLIVIAITTILLNFFLLPINIISCKTTTTNKWYHENLLHSGFAFYSKENENASTSALLLSVSLIFHPIKKHRHAVIFYLCFYFSTHFASVLPLPEVQSLILFQSLGISEWGRSIGICSKIVLVHVSLDQSIFLSKCAQNCFIITGVTSLSLYIK
jgi:hypothetical protein